MRANHYWFRINVSLFLDKPSDKVGDTIMADSSLEGRQQSFIECLGKSCSFDPELITPEYVYRMWGGQEPLNEIEQAMRLIKN